ncbi:MAG: hypothetical protein E6Q37_00675 [Crocinitomicaceae bacterium]|nr:MAG: hypothetical protein E6Q37_00675 [Crocinitomicaceae bacterium]
MKIFFTFCLLLLGYFTTNAQGISHLTAEEKAYLFHIVRKSPILENNIGRYFEYKGPVIRFPNKEINYDSLETIIINQPEVLFIRTSEIAKSPKGLLAEAANKMALWELNKVLLAKRLGEKELALYQTQYQVFEQLLIAYLPQKAFRNENGIATPHPKIDNLLNPSLSFDDKKAMIGTFNFLELDDQLSTLNAINLAVNKYVEKRTEELFRALGGEAVIFSNVLVAAGDGSNTSGLLEEREKDEKGRWNKGLPKAVGLFPYQLVIKPADKKVKAQLEPLRFTSNDFKTAGENRITNLHMDVWGYNAEKQTTVVIEKNGLTYHLFGSGETRFLSPDSAFAKGNTFQSIINDLKNNKIAKLDEMIYGKRGFDYWIEYNEKKKKELIFEIERNEKEISDMRYKPITTSKKSKVILDNKVVDKTKSGKKTRKARQELLVQQYNELDALKKKIADLKKDKAEAIDLQALYQRKLDYYSDVFGRNWASFTEKDGLYTFQDSTTFDILTQEFQFPAKEIQEDFEVRLIAIPYSSISNEADEVMLHIHLADAKPNYDARLQINLEDVFASDKWDVPGKLLQPSDSVAVRQFFEALANKKNPFSVIARGQGIGKWNGVKTVKDRQAVELTSYPGNNQEEKQKARQDSTFVRLRKSEVFINLDRKIVLEINSFTDPVASNLAVSNSTLMELMKKYNLSKNQVLSAYRTAAILKQLNDELNVLAGEYLTRPTAKIVIDRLNSEISKTKITIGTVAVKLETFFE